MGSTELIRFDVTDALHGAVPCAAIHPRGCGAGSPLCLFLYGGGGSRESLADIAPLLSEWWERGLLPPMVVATPDVGPWSFYLDDPARGLGWESFVAARFLPYVQERLALARGAVGAVGISMGGYGALKLAFSRAGAFAAVAAVSPMIEPAEQAVAVPLRNRFHYPPEVPQALLGPSRDAALYQSDHPAARARRHATALRESALAIFLDSAGDDALNAHDGAEYLHRVLWELDIRHEYRLRHGCDHVGPELIERLRTAFVWVGERLVPPPLSPWTPEEKAWQRWLDGHDALPPNAPLAPTSRLFPRLLRAQLAQASAAAAREDVTCARAYGRLAPPRGEAGEPA